MPPAAVPMLDHGLMALGVGIPICLVLRVILRLVRSAPLSQDDWRLILGVAEKAVLAVEQVHGDLAGVDRKRLAEDLVVEMLAHFGMQVPRSLVDTAIEAAVPVMQAVMRGRGRSPADSGSKGVA